MGAFEQGKHRHSVVHKGPEYVVVEGYLFCHYNYSLCPALGGAVARRSGDWPEKRSVEEALFVFRGWQLQKAEADSEFIPICIEK